MLMDFQPMLPPTRVAAMKEAGHWRDETVLDHLSRARARRRHDIALVDHNSMTGERTQLSYGELGARVDRIAAGLLRLGVERGDVVSYQLPNWWQFTALHLACMRIGAVTNPLMPIFREREIEFMLGLGEAKVFVVPRSFRDFDHAGMGRGLLQRLPKLRHLLVIGGEGAESFDENLQAHAPDAAAERAFAERAARPDDVIEVLYTSGTTGEPKGVMHTSNTLLSNIVPYAEALGLGSSDVILMASPLAHQTGFMYGLMMPIYLGAKAVLQDVWNPARAADLIAAERVSFTMASTPFLSDLADAAAQRPEAFASLRIFLAAGAPIPRVLVRRAGENLGASIVSAWGMTENGAVTITRLDDPPEKAFETDGRALPGMECRIVDELKHPMPAGREGFLQVCGCSNFVGYLKRPQWYATDAEGWFDTGDFARMDRDGYIRITGRAKDIIIRGGENIPVVEIEGLIYRHPKVQEVAIVAMPDRRLGERACAFVVTRAGAPLTLGEIVEFLSEQKIAKQYLPERLEVVDQLPKTPSGKIQKFKLRETAKAFGGAA
jgi:cyclohexanecarboxylate-CoA ligase